MVALDFNGFGSSDINNILISWHWFYSWLSNDASKPMMDASTEQPQVLVISFELQGVIVYFVRPSRHPPSWEQVTVFDGMEITDSYPQASFLFQPTP